ncbi:MAG: hypothetical protein WD845_15160 [Pirellulales bacterium]
MTDASPPAIHCQECSAANEPGNTLCWLCGRRFNADEPISAQLVSMSPLVAPPQFALSTMMLIITLICVCLGVLTIAPGLVVPLVAVVVPALFRTVSATKRMARQGQEVTIADRVATFSTSLGVVFLTWIAGLVAFAAACATAVGVALSTDDGGGGNAGIAIAIGISIAGALGALLLMIMLLVKSWPKRK